MKLLTIIGLFFDFIGVLLLGFDLVRVQRKLRTDAESRLASLSEVIESTESIDTYLKNITADWRNYADMGEGLYEPISESFDHHAAKYSLDEIKSGVSGLADDLHTLAMMMLVSVKSDRETVKLSLGLSYIGLALIALGFILQILAIDIVSKFITTIL